MNKYIKNISLSLWDILINTDLSICLDYNR